MNAMYFIIDFCFLLQYSFLLITILLVESTILFCGYWFRNKIEKGFHAAMSNGLQYYGKEPSLSSVVDDIQSTVRYNIFWYKFLQIGPFWNHSFVFETVNFYFDWEKEYLVTLRMWKKKKNPLSYKVAAWFSN